MFERLDQALIRLFQEDEDLPVRIVIDVSASMQTSGNRKLHTALRVAAALSYISLASLDRVGLICGSKDHHQRLPTQRGRGRIFRVFEFLQNCPSGGQTDIRGLCARVAAQNPEPGITIVLSDFYDLDGAFEGVNLLRFRKHETIAIQIIDPQEANPSDRVFRGDISLVDAEGGQMQELTLAPDALEAYRRAHAEFCEKLRSQCRSRGILFLEADVTEPFDETVLRLFRQGGLVG